MLTAAAAERGARDQEEGHVGADLGGDPNQIWTRQPAAPDSIESDERRRCVSAAAAESGARRNRLFQPHNGIAWLAIAFERPPQRGSGTPDQIRSICRNPSRT